MNENLSKFYVDYVDDPQNNGKTFDDFFDEANVPVDQRSDFLVASILKGALEIITNERVMI